MISQEGSSRLSDAMPSSLISVPRISSRFRPFLAVKNGTATSIIRVRARSRSVRLGKEYSPKRSLLTAREPLSFSVVTLGHRDSAHNHADKSFCAKDRSTSSREVKCVSRARFFGAKTLTREAKHRDSHQQPEILLLAIVQQ